MTPTDFTTPDRTFDEPLRLVPEDPDETLDDTTIHRPRMKSRSSEMPVNGSSNNPNNDTHLDHPSDAGGTTMGDALQWAIDALHQPAMASADWLARDIDPSHPSATSLLTNVTVTLEQIRQAKAAYKTMRIVGEKAADRRIGARMYAAAIAAGLVRFNRKISTQSDEALRRGFQGLLDDRKMPQPLRDLAGKALCVLNSPGLDITADDISPPRSKSA
jgi:hypothetical protein